MNKMYKNEIIIEDSSTCDFDNYGNATFKVLSLTENKTIDVLIPKLVIEQMVEFKEKGYAKIEDAPFAYRIIREYKYGSHSVQPLTKKQYEEPTNWITIPKEPEPILKRTIVNSIEELEV